MIVAPAQVAVKPLKLSPKIQSPPGIVTVSGELNVNVNVAEALGA